MTLSNYIHSLMAETVQSDRSLREETSRWWHEVQSRRHDWQRVPRKLRMYSRLLTCKQERENFVKWVDVLLNESLSPRLVVSVLAATTSRTTPSPCASGQLAKADANGTTYVCDIDGYKRQLKSVYAPVF